MKNERFPNLENYWTPEPEVWDAKKCAKIARRRAKDGYGSRHPYPGLVEDSSAPYGYGKRRYNGCIERDGDLWKGTNVPLPIIPPEYVFIHRISWGTFLIRRDELDKLDKTGIRVIEVDEKKARLEYLRGEIEAERISYEEIAELQSLADCIDPGDVLLLQWAGVPETD